MAKFIRQMFIVVTTLLSLCGPTRAQSSAQIGAPVEAQARRAWVDPSTGLMWAGKDNGKDVNWRAAMKFCRSLRLNGHSDWRLANLVELQGIYDKTAEASGLSGFTKPPEPFTWHVKGNLFLTGDEWSGRPVTGRMPLQSYEYHFDFNEGRADKDPSGWPYPHRGMRALCVRGPASMHATSVE